MAGVNKVILLGNLGNDPEVRHLEGGSTVARVSLATSESYKDKDGNRVEQTEWHDVEMWDGLAKIAEQYLHKGDTIYVEGKLRTNTWQDDQGNNRKSIRIRAITMNIVRTKNGPEGAQNSGGSLPAQAKPVSVAQEAAPEPLSVNTDGGFDDLPF